MATENDFNGYLSTHIRRMGKAFKAVKIADKVKTGIPDFLIFHEGRAIAVECKHIAGLPSGERMALKHPVSGPQRTFLISLGFAGVPGFVVIACAADRTMTIVPAVYVPPSGNWTKEGILEARRAYGAYPYMEAERMIRELFEVKVPLSLPA